MTASRQRWHSLNTGGRGKAAAVVDQEAGRACELVNPLRDDDHGQFLAGQIRPGQLEALPGVAVIQVHGRGLLLGPAVVRASSDSVSTSSMLLRRGAS
jgi:hypothetical protein